MSASCALQTARPDRITTTTDVINVAIMAVATIISSSDKPLGRPLAVRFLLIGAKSGDFRRKYGPHLADIEHVVGIVVAIGCHRDAHQSVGNSTTGRAI